MEECKFKGCLKNKTGLGYCKYHRRLLRKAGILNYKHRLELNDDEFEGGRGKSRRWPESLIKDMPTQFFAEEQR